ncbi:hypothetical protein LEP1GSC103_1939 [Leptospira borgpetersenii serovar Javanica str. UI 09931]|uniref:Uncharacterized protein n=2 Tax=Leptospira borgpetersenii TaxID=174 RepID=A0A0E3BLX9_LEPBO|nr:hypothetical protein LBBP_02467 [Leptospira borgpetersenii serovar Ballum]ANH01257.2 Uncharacterized protein LB4E_1953 [Leptospira borgpetersenii str. 4E]EKQ93062.1 hypothetical protein LEP1GSC101_4003 [Leptospira borgpetersenii str. UI 09149]EKR01428.1 hypothetical protein LEP1GSC121_2940 [Leptospira borgpetersenii serovar Castellonis str. 200801910]EMN56993.1 hypothetical protein LEP1GSC090_0785 [Leptospira borgpetersenii serovar Javanica str. MK146]EMO08957.1 hypothetical protein LEP1GSC
MRSIDFDRFQDGKILAYLSKKCNLDAVSILKQFQNRDRDSYSNYDLMMCLIDSSRISENLILYLIPRLYDYVLNNPGSSLLFLINLGY